MKLDLNMKKIFSLAMVGIAFLLIVFSFVSYVGYGSYGISLWNSSLLAIGIIQFILLLGVIALYGLHAFKGLKEKWIAYANYAVGFVTLVHLVYFFQILDGGSKVGFWFEFILGSALAVVSVLWNFQSETPLESKKAPIVGYDEKTGQPIYAKVKSYDPKTGKPIYEKN